MENILNTTLESLNISLDLGKMEIKGFSFKNNGEIVNSINFDSVVKEVITNHDYSFNPNPNKFKIVFDDFRYEIGDNVKNGSYCNDNSKANFHHMICLIVATGLLIKENNQHVNIFAGLPSTHISNEANKNDFLNMFKDYYGKSISIEINGSLKTFIIDNIVLESEGIALLPRLEMMLKNNSQEVAVIDIGGHNFNCRLFNDDGYTDDKGISEEEVGINTLIHNLKETLISSMQNRDRVLSNYDIKRFVKNRNLDEDIKLTNFNHSNEEFTNRFVKNYINTYIIHNLSARGIKPHAKGRKYLFTGGGSELLKPYLEEMYNSNIDSIVFSKTSKWDNCISYALNNLFKVNSDKAKILYAMKKSADEKLSYEDKSFKHHTLNQLQSIFSDAMSK